MDFFSVETPGNVVQVSEIISMLANTSEVIQVSIAIVVRCRTKQTIAMEKLQLYPQRR